MSQLSLVRSLRVIDFILSICVGAPPILHILHVGDRWYLPPFSAVFPIWALYQAVLLLVAFQRVHGARVAAKFATPDNGLDLAFQCNVLDCGGPQ